MKIKVIDTDKSFHNYKVTWKGVEFSYDFSCSDYDWLLVYDELIRCDSGTIVEGRERLQCPPEQTVLVTLEPSSIKLYPSYYTNQFGYVLTTHSQKEINHPNRKLSNGSLQWLYAKHPEELLEMQPLPKDKVLSTICSAKRHGHTDHKKRYDLVKYLSEVMPEMDWFGNGVCQIATKNEGMDRYRYHISIENHIAPNHWTEKFSDPILAYNLMFYAGDPTLVDIFPKGSFIPIPIDDHKEAARIIRETIDNNMYEQCLPAICEAREMILNQYNIFDNVLNIVKNHEKDFNKAQDEQCLHSRATKDA